MTDSEAAFASDVALVLRRAEELHRALAEAFEELHQLDRRCSRLAGEQLVDGWDDGPPFRRISDESGLTALWAEFGRLGGTAAVQLELTGFDRGDSPTLQEVLEKEFASGMDVGEQAAQRRIDAVEERIAGTIAAVDQLHAWARDQAGQ